MHTEGEESSTRNAIQHESIDDASPNMPQSTGAIH